MNVTIRGFHVRIGWYWNGLTDDEVFAEPPRWRAFWPIVVTWSTP